MVRLDQSHVLNCFWDLARCAANVFSGSGNFSHGQIGWFGCFKVAFGTFQVVRLVSFVVLDIFSDCAVSTDHHKANLRRVRYT